MYTQRRMILSGLIVGGLVGLLVFVITLSSLTQTAASAALPVNVLLPHAPQAAPDLIIEEIMFSPQTPAIGAEVDITYTIKNQGDAAVSGFYTYLYIDPVDQPPTQTTAYTTRCGAFVPVNPGATFTCVRTGHTFATSGTHQLYAWTDRDAEVAESNEDNNLLGPVALCVGECSPSDTDAYEDDD